MSDGKIALFGGTFDPVHLGHTAVAAFAASHIGAEKVIFVPARRSVLKGAVPIASDGDRLNMLRLATANNKIFEISDYELTKPGPSYTVETVRYFQELPGPDKSIYWLIGADNIGDLPRWYKIKELVDTCNLAVMYRAGLPPPEFDQLVDDLGAARVAKLKANVIQTPLINISSSEIRSRLLGGQDAGDMLDGAVLDYIRRHKLYR